MERNAGVIPNTLIAALLTAISGYTGYAIPGEPPRIVALSHDVLAERVCGRPCGVLGFTLSSGEILIDDALQVGGNPAATSILVHELTHFLQIRSVAHPVPVGLPAVERARARGVRRASCAGCAIMSVPFGRSPCRWCS